MKEKIKQMYIQALIDDLPPNVFADQVLRLINVSGAERKIVCQHCKGKGYITPDRVHSVNCSPCNGTGKLTVRVLPKVGFTCTTAHPKHKSLM